MKIYSDGKNYPTIFNSVYFFDGYMSALLSTLAEDQCPYVDADQLEGIEDWKEGWREGDSARNVEQAEQEIKPWN